MFALINRGELDGTTEHELENLNSRFKNLWLTEHNEDGTHIGFDASIITSGVFPVTVIPDLDASKITTGTISSARLPASIAYTDVANTFIQNQLISKTRSELQLLHSGTTKARIAQFTANSAVFTANASFDGTNWNIDDTGLPGQNVSVSPANGVTFNQFTAGANPRTVTTIFSVGTTGLVTILGQIKFPSTQNASADANTLDDYEEGTWTPALNLNGSTTGITYSSRSGGYTKIGNLVYLDFTFTLSSKGASVGSATITGSPFTATAVSTGALDVAAGSAGLTGSPYMAISGTTIFPLTVTGASARVALADTNFTNTTVMQGSLTFRV